MTYQHALRYMTQTSSNEGHKIDLSTLASLVGKSDLALTVFSFSNDKIGDAAASFLESILTMANIPTLRWIDDSHTEPKNRFTMNAKPLAPPPVANAGAEIQTLERSLRTSGKDALSSSDRCTAVLAQYAKAFDAHVVLLQTDPHVSHVGRFSLFFPRLQGVSILSGNRVLSPSAVDTRTREIISPPCGPTMFHLISDACAKSGSRLTITPKPKGQAGEQALGAQTIQYRALPACRIFSCAPSMSQALSLALECVLSLRRTGIKIPDEAISSGASRASIPLSCSVVSIRPLIVGDRARDTDELGLTLEDLASKCSQMPQPRRLFLDPTLKTDSLSLPAFCDEWGDTKEELDAEAGGTFLVVGSDEFIKTVKKRLKTSKKA